MKILLVVLFILIGLGILLFYTLLEVRIRIEKLGKEDFIQMDLRAWSGIIRYRYRIPSVKVKGLFSSIEVEEKTNLGEKTDDQSREQLEVSRKDIRRLIHKYRMLLRNVTDYRIILHQFLKRVFLVKWEWYTTVGDKDAAATGVLTGFVWGIKSIVSGLLSHRCSLECMPIFNVTPHYHQSIFQTEITCIVRFRAGYAILAGIRILLNMRKGREPIWQNTQFKV